MYLLPLLFSNLHLGLDAPVGSLDPTLGRMSPVRPEDLTRIYPTASFDRGVLDFYYRPWAGHQDVLSSTMIGDKVFKITLDVKQYKPEEVNVKVVDRWVVVEAKHEATEDDGNVLSRQFVRKYLLPSRAEVGQVSATISSDHLLIVTAPMKPQDERVIKIEQTGKPAVSPNSQKEAGESELSETVPAVERKSEDNKVVREEVTATQAQEAGPKPEK
ncbi:protein lethal(2)essential for life-like [Temnothorax curvispinosus]|uniref:Protein lethal(2)essential for life-like n=1 Tax=Temnothorax curvispinosus TaxID=300111 RepID=A0A6J1Q3F5_9HYME|nr:protein lethal(2)essential for life-like [Temnothorax curvispinosus]